MNVSLTITLARDASGAVDVDASVEAFKTAVHQHIAARETETATIALAVDDLFSSKPGARLNMPYVQSSVATALNAQPENFKALGERIAVYIRENAGDRDSGKLFHIGKGKVGGVTRWSDQPAPKPETAK